MALFVSFFLVLINCLTTLSGSQTSKNVMLEIKPVTVTAGHNVGFYKVDDTLNLTCIFRNHSVLPDVILEWVVPSKASNSEYHVIQEAGTDFVVLIIENLQENDSGDYKCRAVHNGIPFFSSENTVKISVKNKKKECPDVMFQCSAGICISKRYTCDGFRDCSNGEDESPVFCGTGNPCDNKLMCPDNRCIPFSWCCESYREPNCTAKVKLTCCTHVEKLTRDIDSDLGYQYEQQRFSDIGFLQTTVYTVIGCAMAFMFIVTIIVIAICRVHVRRSLLSRCPAASRNVALRRGGHIQGNHLNGLSFYDLDLYFNRPDLSGNDLMSVNPLLVTYNINNGVQFVGRPIDPPPYCEIVTSPPKEGPPPPYASQENLFSERENKVEEAGPKGGEIIEVCSEAEVTESDALLGATSQSISVISCSAIDVTVPLIEEVPNPENSDSSGTSDNRSTDIKNTYKRFSDVENSEFSSQTDAGKSVNESKNSGLGIVVLNHCESVIADTEGNVKIHNGESSFCLSSSCSDISKGAVKKTVSAKSLDPIKKQ